jgi:hypothetical protein
MLYTNVMYLKHSDNVFKMPLFCGLLKSRYILNIWKAE